MDRSEKKPPQTGVTVHEFPDGKKMVIELNYSDMPVNGIPANGMRIKLPQGDILFPA